MSTSSGAEATLSRFLIRKRRGERVMSESEPRAKVTVARERPMMVKYWKCQP